jgi:hypothetical protein
LGRPSGPIVGESSRTSLALIDPRERRTIGKLLLDPTVTV